MATFAEHEAALAAVTELLDAGFLNVSEEQDGTASLVVVDPGEAAGRARAIFARHGGVELTR